MKKILTRGGFVWYEKTWGAIAAYDAEELEYLNELMEKNEVHIRTFATPKGCIKGEGKIQAIDVDHGKYAFIGIGKPTEGSEILEEL